jgi:hypothetical protein
MLQAKEQIGSREMAALNLKSGDFVEHESKPDWGIGQVLAVRGDKVDISFSHGGVTLNMRYVGSQLKIVPADRVPPRNTLTKSLSKGSTGTSLAGHQARNAPCEACDAPLNRSRRSRDGRWKSCPQCSVRDGTHHVFYPFPDSFGVSEARVSGEDAEGAQSYCTSCRGRGQVASGVRRSCPEMIAELAP